MLDTHRRWTAKGIVRDVYIATVTMTEGLRSASGAAAAYAEQSFEMLSGPAAVLN